jgi:hypothetical protein
MRTIRSKTGPFIERPHFSLAEIEEICTTELQRAGLYPSSPERIRIDRFVEKRFVNPRYESLPPGVLGFTSFGPKGVEAIVISSQLDDPSGGKPNDRRLRTTLAHEAGHCLMHAHLFCLGTKPKSLFGDSDETPEILCRDIPWKDAPIKRGYDGRWWEFQANKAIGGLLMPRHLVEEVVEKFTTKIGSFGQRTLAPEKRESAIRALVDIFDVNRIAAQIRVADVFPPKNEAQLSF